MNQHEGHRARKKHQLRDHGLETFADHEVLELLLYYAIPRRDTNSIAHELLRRFGSLEWVFNASVEELQSVPGVGENAALLVYLVRQLGLRAAKGPLEKPVILNTSKRIGGYLLTRYRGEVCEVVYQLCLDQKGKLLACHRVSEGGGGSADFNLRTILMNAIRCGASMVVLAHNHPSGLALPSEADIVATSQVQQALEILGIRLLDHMVVADGDYVSMAQNGTLRQGSL